jgi:Ca2+-binding RTX toxin-like protein
MVISRNQSAATPEEIALHRRIDHRASDVRMSATPERPEAGSPLRRQPRRRIARGLAVVAAFASPIVVAGAPAEAAPPVDFTIIPTCAGKVATMVGTAGNDTITGTSGNDVIVGLGGNDTIYGSGGDDIICGGYGADRLYGGAGSDPLFGGAGDDWLAGGNGQDAFTSSATIDEYYGEDGDDTLIGSGGVDFMSGGGGTDTLLGYNGDDTLYAGFGADSVYGGSGSDSLFAFDNVFSGYSDSVDIVDGGPNTDSCQFDYRDKVTSCP